MYGWMYLCVCVCVCVYFMPHTCPFVAWFVCVCVCVCVLVALIPIIFLSLLPPSLLILVLVSPSVLSSALEQIVSRYQSSIDSQSKVVDAAVKIRTNSERVAGGACLL